MLSPPRNVRIFVATQPTDLRRSFDGLSAMVDGTFGKQALSGDLFLFMNRRANQVRKSRDDEADRLVDTVTDPDLSAIPDV